MSDGTYPNYLGNSQDEGRDVPGDDTIANARDYNVHDIELLVHQAVLKALQEGSLVLPAVSLADGGKIYLDETKSTYIVFNKSNNQLEIFIGGEKQGHFAVSS